jgi:DNA-binding LacI/PurR family transcriptional regulator
VARLAGVSIATASRVAAGGHVREATRQRVEQAIAATGWMVNPTARLLASGKGDEVALVVVLPDAAEAAEDPYYSRVLAGVAAEAARHGLCLSAHFTDRGSLPGLAPFSGDRRYVGAILVNVDEETAAPMCGRRTAVVSMGASAAGVPALEPENYEGASRAVEHLLTRGRRRVVTVAGPAANPCARERLVGYRSVLQSAGLPPHGHTADFTRPGAARATRRLLDAHPDLDAVFVASDLMSTAVLQVLAENGRSVPGDVAVVGFDDSAPARMTTPQLTTVSQPVERIAAQAVRTLLQPAGQRPPLQRLPTGFVVRASSAA